MQIKIKAIVLTSIKYGEADLIVKCLTEVGIRSYMLRNILRSNSKKLRAGYFQPLSQLEISALHNNRGNLNRITEARVYYLYQTLATNIYKQSIAQFLTEVLALALKEEEQNAPQFNYILFALQWLDNHNNIANFHLVFLFELSKYLGFYPDVNVVNKDYFDLEEGIFTFYKPDRNYISGKVLDHFKSLIGIKFDDMEKLKWNSEKRHVILDLILLYYELHLPGFKKPRSLKILKEVFNENP